MKLFTKLPSRRGSAGMERVILRLLPKTLLAGIAIPLLMAVGRRLLPPEGTDAEVAKAIATVDIFSIATAATVCTAVFTVALGCIVVVIMKGPAYVADAYDLNDANRPDPGDR